MLQLIELYEMAGLNEDALGKTERLSILRARLALGTFERAMRSFKAEFFQTPAGPEISEGPSGCQETSALATGVTKCS
jgi:hypothetical protein